MFANKNFILIRFIFSLCFILFSCNNSYYQSNKVFVNTTQELIDAFTNENCTEVELSDGVFNIGYINIPNRIKIIKGANKTKLIGCIYICNAENFSILNIDFDCSNYSEGLIVENSNNLLFSNLNIEGKSNNNHAFLIEKCSKVILKEIHIKNSYQGLAIKCDGLELEGFTSYNCNPWGLTIRYSPYAKCQNVNIKNVNISGGGISFMNDENNCELNNIYLENINIYDGLLYFINNNNNISMHNIKIDNINFFECKRDYVIQFFGNPRNISIQNAKFNSCIQPIIINQGKPSNLEFINFTFKNGGITSVFDGNNIYCENFDTDLNSGWFIDNISKDLKIKNFKKGIGIANRNGGNYIVVE